MAFIRSKLIRGLVIVAAALFLAAGGAGIVFYLDLTRDLPNLQSIEDYRPPLTTRVLDRRGRIIAEFSVERRQLAAVDAIPRHTRVAFVAAEDKSFFEHKGIDYSSILRAALANLRGGRIEQGASTITQQMVKGLLLTPEKTFRRKFREMILARQIEQHFSKDDILYLYLNQIYFGHGAWGIGEAARTYFDKDVRDLSISESALLAGLPQRPNSWQPFKNPEAADRRRRYVLKRMLEDGYISQAEYDGAVESEPVAKAPEYRREHAADYFTESVRRTLFEQFTGEQVLTGGLVVETTVDLDLQRTAVAAVRRGIQELDHRQGYRGPVRQVAKAQISAEIQQLGEALVEELGGPAEVAAEAVLLGVVTEVDREAQLARVALGPELEGVVKLEDVRWAREPDRKRSPKPVKHIDLIFEVGDVVRFEVLGELEEESAAAEESELAQVDQGSDGSEGEEPLPELPRTLQLGIHQEPEVEGALLSLEVGSGDVLAMVGGYDFARSQFNRVTQALRQPGSAFKPLIYGAALSQGYTPVETLYDRPVVYEDPVTGFKYKPENYERRFFGPVLMRYALAHSINNATVHLFRDLGVDYVIDYARQLGIQSPLSRDLSLAIGSSSVTLLELTTAYAVFPNGGRRVVPRFINRVTDRDGRVLMEDVPLGKPPPLPNSLAAAPARYELAPYPDVEEQRSDEILPADVAYLMSDLLKAVVEEGTGRRLRDLGRPLAGKTGTTNDFVDAWFMGFAPDVVTGVWVGQDQRDRLGWGESGARAALPIWKEFMAAALQDYPARDFEVPEHIEFARIDRKTGLLADRTTENAYLQPFRSDNVPTETAGRASDSTDTERMLRADSF